MANVARSAFLLAFTAAITGCGGSGGGSDGTIRQPEPPPVANAAPTISGTPAISVTRDDSYAFTPSASDPDGDTLTFSITNRPTWADFDTETGTLTGTPSEADIGTTTGVTISVSDGTLSASLAPFDLEVLQIALGSATVYWQIPVTNADGSPLDDLAGFEVHYGTESQTYTEIVPVNDPTIDNVRIDNLSPATYFFAVLAVDSSGNKSALSVEASKDVQP